MELAMAMTPTVKCLVVLLFTGVAAPIAGLIFRQVAEGWDSIGQGPLAIDPDLPQGRPPELASPANPAVREAEARQMIEAKSYRRKRRGEAGIDVEAEVRRALEAVPSQPTLSEELRAEVRDLVLARNERLLRQGKVPLDVEAEVERQVADFIGSS